MKILNFGSCNIDYVYRVDQIVSPGETVNSESMDIFPGGKGLNQSVAAAKAGAEIYHAGYIGNDGALLFDTMNSCGVRLDYLRQVNVQCGHAIIQVDKNGMNSIIVFKGCNGISDKDYVCKVLNDFTANDILLVQNEIADVPFVIEKAYEKGMTVALNPSPFTDVMKNIDLNMITYLILNETEAKGYTGTDEPVDIVSSIRSNYPELRLMLTLGDKGCIYADKKEIIRRPAFSVDAVDTTAAGDTFTGYFLACIAEGADHKTAIRYASAAAAITVSRKGASVSVPIREETENFLSGYHAKKGE